MPLPASVESLSKAFQRNWSSMCPCRWRTIVTFLRRSLTSLLATFVALTVTASAQAPSRQYDVVVYGGTAAAVMAAVQVTKMGKTVVIVSPDKHLGGLSSGGLGFTDTGDKSVIGGLSREFYQRIWAHYDKPAAWRWQKREEYGNKGQGTPAIDGEHRTMWIFEPHVAERVFEERVKTHKIQVDRDQWLDRTPGNGPGKGVATQGDRI